MDNHTETITVQIHDSLKSELLMENGDLRKHVNKMIPKKISIKIVVNLQKIGQFPPILITHQLKIRRIMW